MRSLDDFGVALTPLSDETASLAARGLGRLAAQYEPILAAYWIGQSYTYLLPDSYRAQFGVFYTPPALTVRLIELASEGGVDWGSATVLDPACGGGAFLAPAALTMRDALKQRESPAAILAHIAGHLRGFELDPFGAWMSQVLVEAAVHDLCVHTGRRLPLLVKVCDALEELDSADRYDLVIGNPPYGRIGLDAAVRRRYARSIYGHANLYALFMELAVRLTRPGGTIALVTPTGFLGGQYFRNLRALMAGEAPPAAIDLVSSRKGVFTDVLQETLLAVYRRSGRPTPARVHVVELQNQTAIRVEATGIFRPPEQISAPWLLPRGSAQATLIERMQQLPQRLRDYGYKVSTGPLVWNRHKAQLRDHPGDRTYPIIWAESVARNGRFVFRAEKKNHSPYIQLRKGDEWLITRQACVIVQRTTAKEQHRRLIAAELPAAFIAQSGGVCVENHLNMIRPLSDNPAVPLRVLAALLGSATVDDVFRCINGSVAVSASELEALPLPSVENTLILSELLLRNAGPEVIENAIRSLYFEDSPHRECPGEVCHGAIMAAHTPAWEIF